VIDDMQLIPGKGGVFEFTVNGNLVYSKKASGRHAEAGELLQLFERLLGPGVPKYHD
jgi:selenoprotein W-related protein